VTDEQLERDEDKIIGRALDALDFDEVEILVDDRDDVDDVVDVVDDGARARLDLDPATDDETLEYYEVLSHLPFAEATPAEALETRVLDAALAQRPPIVPSLTSRRRRRARIVALGAAAAVAAAVTLVVVVDNGSSTPSRTQAELIRFNPSAVQGLVDTPGARRVDLTGVPGTIGSVVVTPRGDGALYNIALTPEPGTTYWFWVSGSKNNVAIGPVATLRGSGLNFDVNGPMTGAFVTAEPSGTVPRQPGTLVARGNF